MSRLILFYNSFLFTKKDLTLVKLTYKRKTPFLKNMNKYL